MTVIGWEWDGPRVTGEARRHTEDADGLMRWRLWDRGSGVSSVKDDGNIGVRRTIVDLTIPAFLYFVFHCSYC